MTIDTSSAESLFHTLMAPLYPDELRRDLATARGVDVNPGKNPQILAQLDEIATVFARLADDALGAPLALDRTDASVHRLGQALTRERRDELLRQRDPDGVPLLAQVVLHGAVYVGACVVTSHAGEWRVRQPLWESRVNLVSRAGEGELSLLSWWLRALADDEIGRDTLSARYRMHVEVPTTRPEDHPVLIADARKLPRLKRPSYDTLHKYLRAHLPELRDVGRDFPSPERFAELSFAWLDFVLVGGGRGLVLHGPTDQGIHLFWLDAGGFTKAAYYPADAFPEHLVKLDGDRLSVILPWLGKNVVHEMLWWGP